MPGSFLLGLVVGSALENQFQSLAELEEEEEALMVS
jgi:hypothetical protein